MPYQLTWEPEGVYRHYRGVVTIDERRRSFDAICSDARFDGLRYTITDYLAVTDYESNPEATEEIAALHVGPLMTNPKILIAAVAVRPDVVAAVRHFMALNFVSRPYELFADVAQARQWIADQRQAASSLLGLRPVNR